MLVRHQLLLQVHLTLLSFFTIKFNFKGGVIWRCPCTFLFGSVQTGFKVNISTFSNINV